MFEKLICFCRKTKSDNENEDLDSSDILEVATIQNGRAVFGKLSIIGKQLSECKLGNKGKEIELSKEDETDFSELPVIAN